MCNTSALMYSSYLDFVGFLEQLPAPSSSEESLQQELAADKESSAVLLDTIEELKKRSEESQLLLMKVFQSSQTGTSSQA